MEYGITLDTVNLNDKKRLYLILDFMAEKDLSKSFSVGFFDVDIYEFESRNENGISIYQKRIVKILSRKTLKDAEVFL